MMVGDAFKDVWLFDFWNFNHRAKNLHFIQNSDDIKASDENEVKNTIKASLFCTQNILSMRQRSGYAFVNIILASEDLRYPWQPLLGDNNIIQNEKEG